VTRDAEAGGRAASTNLDSSGLRKQILALAAELGMPGEPGYPEAAERLLATGIALVEAEEQALELKRNRRRRSNKTGAVISGTVLGLECVGLGAASIAGLYSPYWLLLIVPLLFFAMGMFSLGTDKETDTTKQLYPSPWPPTIAALGAGATLGLIVNHVLAGPFSVVTAILGVMATGAFAPEAVKPQDETIELDPASAEDSEVNDAVPTWLPEAEPSADEGQDPEVSGLIKQVRSLEGQIASLSTVIARSGLAPGADLGQVGPDDARLLSLIMQGRQARNELLSVPERSARLAVLTEAGESTQNYLETVARTVNTAELLARMRPRSPQYTGASSEFRKDNAEFQRVKAAHDNLAARAERCVEELKADDRARQELTVVLQPNEDAYRSLLGRFRVRLRGEIERGAILPAWLINSLGPTPPLRSPDAWYEIAASVLAHRAIYAIDADDSALGPRPLGPDHVRLTEFDRLQESLRRRDWNA
jgi:hypothetical protein